MAYLFLDTSALMKFYLSERGSGWLKAFSVGKQLAIAELALFESATVLRRRYLEGSFTRKQASKLYAQIYQERFNYEIVPFGNQRQYQRFVSQAFNLSGGLRIRALDGIQLSAARVIYDRALAHIRPEPFTFVSSDAQLLRVAQALSFATENPEDYP